MIQLTNPEVRVNSNKFDLSHDIKLSMNMGSLVPHTIIECLPGDKFYISNETLLRFSALVAPVMHRIHVTQHFYFVPYRLLWSNWEKWITGQYDVLPPYLSVGGITEGMLGDYLGLPTVINATTKINAMPLAAYFRVYDEYYRDQNLIPETFVPLTDGNNAAYSTLINASPKFRAWEHDYFTSCLPWAQKGDAALIPMSIANPIVEYNAANNYTTWNKKGTTNKMTLDAGVGTKQTTGNTYAISYGDYLSFDPNGTLDVDVNTPAADINSLRRAFRLQEWLEKNARGGTRYNEHMREHFGAISSDQRIDRAEYLGGSKANMVISEVLSTTETSTVPLGGMGGHALSVGGGQGFEYYCEEHGVILGIINVQPITAYQQGINRMFLRQEPLDYAWPVFADIGEQEVMSQEIWANAASDTVFGYMPRYSEYKMIQSRVAGAFKSSLSYWHLGRIFSSEPVLNQSFIEAVPSTRIFADESESHKIYGHIFNNVSVLRKLPMYGIPTI